MCSTPNVVLEELSLVIPGLPTVCTGDKPPPSGVGFMTCMQDRYGNISCPVMVSMAPAGTGTVPASGIGNNETAIAITALQTLGTVYVARETFGHYNHCHYHHPHRHW